MGTFFSQSEFFRKINLGNVCAEFYWAKPLSSISRVRVMVMVVVVVDVGGEMWMVRTGQDSSFPLSLSMDLWSSSLLFS